MISYILRKGMKFKFKSNTLRLVYKEVHSERLSVRDPSEDTFYEVIAAVKMRPQLLNQRHAEERTGSETVPRCGNRQLRVTSAFLLLSDRWMGCHLSKQKSRGEEQSCT